VFGDNGHVDDVEVPAAVTDEPSHPHHLIGAVVHDVAGRPTARDRRNGLLARPGTQTRRYAQPQVVLDGRR
jgi:hypothetical protein